MGAIEETIDAKLDSNGQLQLTHPPSLPPGPVRVTIRAAEPDGPKHGLADVIREIRADQIARGFQGRRRSWREDDVRLAEDAERDRELNAARRGSPATGPSVHNPERPSCP